MWTLDKCKKNEEILITTSLLNSQFGIVTDTITYSGRRINFKDHPVKAYYADKESGRSYLFKVNRILYDYRPGKYAFFSNENVSPVNTRRAFRVKCGYRIVLNRKEDELGILGTCKDISYTGAGIIMSEDYEESLNVGDTITIFIFANETRTQHVISGRIVRREAVSEDRFLIGVEFLVTSKAIVDMVNALQRKELRLRAYGKQALIN